MEVIGRGRDGILVGPGQGGRRRRLHQGAGRGWASFCKVRRGSVPDARGPVGAWWSNGMSGGGGLDSRRLVRAQSSRPPSRVGGFASRSRGRGGASRIAAERPATPATAHVTTNRTIRTQRCVLRPVVDAPGPGRPSGQGRFGGGDGFGGACQWRDPTRRVKRPRDPRRPGLEATARCCWSRRSPRNDAGAAAVVSRAPASMFAPAHRTVPSARPFARLCAGAFPGVSCVNPGAAAAAASGQLDDACVWYNIGT